MFVEICHFWLPSIWTPPYLGRCYRSLPPTTAAQGVQTSLFHSSNKGAGLWRDLCLGCPCPGLWEAGVTEIIQRPLELSHGSSNRTIVRATTEWECTHRPIPGAERKLHSQLLSTLWILIFWGWLSTDSELPNLFPGNSSAA